MNIELIEILIFESKREVNYVNVSFMNINLPYVDELFACVTLQSGASEE